MRLQTLLLLSALAFPTVGCEVIEVPQDLGEAPEGDWTHEETGLVFPRGLGGFGRVQVKELSFDGDFLVGYNRRHLTAPVILTIYVYGELSVDRGFKADEDLRRSEVLAYLDQAKAEIEETYPGAKFLEADHDAFLPLQGEMRHGAAAVFETRQEFGWAETDCLAQVAVFPFGERVFKLRVTFPALNADAANEAVAEMMMAFVETNGGVPPMGG